MSPSPPLRDVDLITDAGDSASHKNKDPPLPFLKGCGRVLTCLTEDWGMEKHEEGDPGVGGPIGVSQNMSHDNLSWFIAMPPLMPSYRPPA
jgi:hypothetical protein